MADVAGVAYPVQVAGVTFDHPPSAVDDPVLYQGVRQRVLSGRLLEDLPYTGAFMPDKVVKANITLAWEDSIAASDARNLAEIASLAGAVDVCLWKRCAVVWTANGTDATFRLPWRLALVSAASVPTGAALELPTEVRVDGVLLDEADYTIGSPDSDGRPLLTLDAVPAAGAGAVRLWAVPLYLCAVTGSPKKIPAGGLELLSLTFEEV